MEDNKQTKQKKELSSLDRFTQLPLIDFSIFVALSFYNRVKSFNESTKNYFIKTENLISTNYEKYGGVLIKFEKQIKIIDSYGHICLDKVEGFIPSIKTFSPNIAYSHLVNKIQSWKNYGLTKIDFIRNFSVMEYVLLSLKNIEKLIDHYYPAVEEEVFELNEKDNLTEHALLIAGKLRKRTVNRLYNIQRIIF